MLNSLVSILIPNYNKGKFLRETIESIINQSYYNWECIIVDDHSNDSSLEIISNFAKLDKRIKFFKRPSDLPKGGNSCRNYALSLAKGKYIQWFDSDDIMGADLLKHRLDHLVKTGADFVLGHGQKFNVQLGDLNMVFSPFFTFPHFLRGFLAIDPPWLTPSLLLKREFITLNNLTWNPDIYCFQDIAYNTLCFLKANNIAIMNNEIDWFWRKVSNSTGNSLYLSKNYNSNVKLLLSLYKAVDNTEKDLVKGMALIIIKNSLQRLGLTQVIKLLNPLLLNRVITSQVYIFLIKKILNKYKGGGKEPIRLSEGNLLYAQIKCYTPCQSIFGTQGVEDFVIQYKGLKKEYATDNIIINNKTYYLF